MAQGLRSPEITAVLADAADLLSDQLRLHLDRLSLVLKPHAEEIDACFRRVFAKADMTPRRSRRGTTSRPARILRSDRPPADFFGWWNTAVATSPSCMYCQHASYRRCGNTTGSSIR